MQQLQKPQADKLTLAKTMPIVVAFVLLIIMASRLVRISTLDLDGHEIWAVWQSQGTVEEIVRWTPYDWGALSFLILGGWQALVGSDPVLLRLLSILLFMVACACIFAIARRHSDDRAGFVSMLVYAAPVGLILFSLFTRGYVVLITLLPLSLFFTLRYFARSTFWNMIGLVLALALMVYIHPTGLLAAGAVGLYTVLIDYKNIRRWVLPASVFIILVISEILNKLQVSAGRIASNPLIIEWKRLNELAEFYIGPSIWLAILWLAVLLITVLAMFRRKRPRFTWLLFAWGVLGLLFLRIAGPLVGIEAPRHSWWIVLPLALWFGWGLSRLPRAGIGLVSIFLVTAMYAPLSLNTVDDSAFANPRLDNNFRWLQQHIQWGDVMLIDPNSACAPFLDEWDYYTQLYFPNGLTFVSEPTDYRRIWYVTSSGFDDVSVRHSIETGRKASIFVGEPGCVFQLFTGAPNPEGVPFENGMRFHGVEVLEDDSTLTREQIGPLLWHEGDTLHLRLWWSSDQPLTMDYSVAVHLYDDVMGTLLAQSDGSVQPISLMPMVDETAMGTSTWSPGQLYVEERSLTLPDDIARVRNGFRTLTGDLIVYQWWDGTRVSAAGMDSEQRLFLFRGGLRSW